MTSDRASLTGLYAEIRHLEQVGPDRFRAYDASEKFLLEVDAEGADQILDADPYRVRVTRLTPSSLT